MAVCKNFVSQKSVREIKRVNCLRYFGYFRFAPQIFAPRDFEGAKIAVGKTSGGQKSGRQVKSID